MFKKLESKVSQLKFLEILTILLVIWSVYQLFIFINIFSGDAEIHLIFAKNFVNGHFLEFNPGYKTGGESSFLYFLIISILYKLFGIYSAYGMKIISLFSYLWIAYLIYDINPSKNIYYRILGACLITCVAKFTYHGVLGMENIFFSAFLLTLISKEIKSNFNYQNKNIIIKSILLFLLRPEAIFYPFFLSIKSLYTKNKELLIRSILSIILCFITYKFLSFLSGGDFHNAGKIRTYLSSLSTENASNINILGYQIYFYAGIFRDIIYIYPLLILLLFFKNNLRRNDYLVALVFIVIPIFLHLFLILPTVQFFRYFLYGYALIFLIFANRVLPNFSKTFAFLLGVLYLSLSMYAGLTNNFKCMAKCDSFNNFDQCHTKVQDVIFNALPKNIKIRSDELYNEFSNYEGEIIDLATVEVQLRNNLDERFRVWSLDGITDSTILNYLQRDHIDHFRYLEERNIQYLMDLPNLNRKEGYPALSDFVSSLNYKQTPDFCTLPGPLSKKKECIIKKDPLLKSECIKNKRLIKTNVKSHTLNLGGWNGSWIWKVDDCN